MHKMYAAHLPCRNLMDDYFMAVVTQWGLIVIELITWKFCTKSITAYNNHILNWIETGMFKVPCREVHGLSLITTISYRDW